MRKWLLVGLLCIFSLPLLTAAQDPFSLPLGTVIIDAGHGGHDPGASFAWAFAGGTIYERDLTLDIAKRLQGLLAVSHPELNLVMTRTDDTFVSLADRSSMGYEAILKPQTSALFVSIHVNSAQSRDASGFEILTKLQSKKITLLDEATPMENIPPLSGYTGTSLNRLLNNRNLAVAGIFDDELSSSLRPSPSRGVKERDLYVLNASRMPAVMVEVGFITNEEDARNLVSAQWRQRVAQSLAEAINRCV